MPPATGYDPIGTVQQAITALLATQEPQFLGIGHRMFLSFATILLAWHGIRMMLAWRQSGEHMFSFAKLLLFIAFGYAMIAYYASPIPGIGISFSNLITDQTGYLADLISARSIQNAQQSLNSLWNALEQPDAWSILANLLYWTLLLVIAFAQFALLFVVCFSMIASGGLRARGPALRAVLHRADAGVAVLGLAQGVRPVRVHPRDRQCLHLHLRAVSEPIPADAAARHAA